MVFLRCCPTPDPIMPADFSAPTFVIISILVVFGALFVNRLKMRGAEPDRQSSPDFFLPKDVLMQDLPRGADGQPVESDELPFTNAKLSGLLISLVSVVLLLIVLISMLMFL